MRVLVTGAGGFLGHQIVSQLLERGHSVRAMVRPASPEPLWGRDVDIFRADLRVSDNLTAAFENIDAVMHVAAATSGSEDIQFASSVVATERFLEAMSNSSVKRLVHVSSLVVYDWESAVGVLDEDTPLLKNPFDMGAYTIAKLWQERVIKKYAQAHDLGLTIMRPGFIWGPNHAKIAGMGRQFGRFYLLFGPFTRLPLSHVFNCANCIVAAAESSVAIGQTFNVIDSDDIRVWRYAGEYARRTGQRGFRLPIPYSVGYNIARLALRTSRLLYGNKGKLPSLLTPRRFESQFKPVRFSTKKLAEVLTWRPPLSFAECLDLTYGPRR